MMKKQGWSWAAPLFGLVLGAAGCGKSVNLSSIVGLTQPGSPNSSVPQNNATGGNGPSGPIGPSGPTTPPVQAFKPALAVRGASCLMCHTQIHSNIITDFGYGDPQFFGNQKAKTIYPANAYVSDTKPLTLPWYGNYYGAWQLADGVSGTLYVPRILSSVGSAVPVSLASILSLDLGASYYGDPGYSGTGPMLGAFTPAAGNPHVQEMSQVTIGAPTAAQIQGLTRTLSANAIGWEAVGTGSSVLGLAIQAGTGGNYVTNSGAKLRCIGDVVVQGTLFLNDVMIDTDDGGCRLMATGSIFVQGQVLYANTSGTENLQLSSARAILLGFNSTTLTKRLAPQWYPDAQPLTRAPGTNTQKNAAILAEAQVIGGSLHDSTEAASCPTSMVTYGAVNGHGQKTTLTQCSIEFYRLLLNAPNIESRYIGRFNGVAIAEIALFAPGALDFAYDPVFDSANLPILPQLGSGILNVQ